MSPKSNTQTEQDLQRVRIATACFHELPSMTTPSRAVEILYVGSGEGRPLTTRSPAL